MIKHRVEEALAEIERIAAGTLITSGLGSPVTFKCSCGWENKRRAALLKDGSTVSCANPNCPETYTVEHRPGGTIFSRREVTWHCACGHEERYPYAEFEVLPKLTQRPVTCPMCSAEEHLSWQLVHIRPSGSGESGSS